MKIMVRFGILFYMVMTLFLGCFMLIFVLNLIPFREVIEFLYIIYHDPKIRGIFGVVAIVILLKNYIYSRAISGSQEREKTIAFDNPGGRVTVSLTVLEDLIRRVTTRLSEVREVRSSITAGKKGFEIRSRLVLNTDVNIPEMTAKVQELIKRKIQDAIGIEETIVVSVDVVKIISDKTGARHLKEQEESVPVQESTIPFQGYRA